MNTNWYKKSSNETNGVFVSKSLSNKDLSKIHARAKLACLSYLQDLINEYNKVLKEVHGEKLISPMSFDERTEFDTYSDLNITNIVPDELISYYVCSYPYTISHSKFGETTNYIIFCFNVKTDKITVDVEDHVPRKNDSEHDSSIINKHSIVLRDHFLI